jgi:phage-related protein
MNPWSKPRWRDYTTASGSRPVKEFLADPGLTDVDRAAILAGMKEVRDLGLRAARHIEGELYEVRASGQRSQYRILFAQDAAYILLALDAYAKQTQKMPAHIKDRALARLRDWRARGGRP